jgi:hypothetical protein
MYLFQFIINRFLRENYSLAFFPSAVAQKHFFRGPNRGVHILLELRVGSIPSKPFQALPNYYLFNMNFDNLEPSYL